MTRSFPVFPDVCWTVSGYAGTRDFDDIFLGVDKTLEVLPVVKLSALFKNNDDVASFFDWWEGESANGVDTFIVILPLFGKASSYGVRQITPLEHRAEGGNLITFTAEILFDSDTVDNEPPEALPMTIYVEENSENNFVVLQGTDAEGDTLEYTNTEPTYGTLTGTAPNLLYSPHPGYEGEDSFTFIVKDVFNESQEAVVTIVVGAIEVAEAKFAYYITDSVIVNGNFHYRFSDNIVKRGGGGYLVPPAIYEENLFVSRASLATYIDSGLVKYAVIDEKRLEDGTPLYEEESENLCIESEDFTAATWLSYGTTETLSSSQLAPDEVKYATELKEGSSTTRQTLTDASIPIVTPGALKSASIFVKRGSGLRDLTFYMTDAGYQSVARAGTLFDLANGVVKSNDSATNFTIV